MEKEQIVKALEVLEGAKVSVMNRDFNEFQTAIITAINALSLIHEQEKRIEELENICESYALQYGTATDKEVFLIKERADTVRKMVERLKEKAIDVDTDDAALWMECVTIEDVNQIAKELLEDKS